MLALHLKNYGFREEPLLITSLNVKHVFLKVVVEFHAFMYIEDR